MDVTKRVKKIIEYYNISAVDFANKVGIQKSSVSHLLSGRNKPSFDFVNKLASAFEDVNIDWFITGKGKMIIRDDKIHGAPSTTGNLNDNDTIVVNKKVDIKKKTSVMEVKKETDNNIATINTEVNTMILIYDDGTFEILRSR